MQKYFFVLFLFGNLFLIRASDFVLFRTMSSYVCDINETSAECISPVRAIINNLLIGQYNQRFSVCSGTCLCSLGTAYSCNKLACFLNDYKTQQAMIKEIDDSVMIQLGSVVIVEKDRDFPRDVFQAEKVRQRNALTFFK